MADRGNKGTPPRASGRAESIPGEWDDGSIEVDVDLVRQMSAEALSQEVLHLNTQSLADLWPSASRSQKVIAPDIVLFDPMGFQLGDVLNRLGFPHRVAQSGVDVMAKVSAEPTGLVLCGPSEDAERRRLLTAALSVRFPTVPVVYASTHARNPEAVAGAKKEGALEVLPLPFPSDDVLKASLSRFAKPGDPISKSEPPAIESAPTHSAMTPVQPIRAMRFDDDSIPQTLGLDPGKDEVSIDSYESFEDAKTDAMEAVDLEEIKRDGLEHEESVIRPRRFADGKGMWTFPQTHEEKTSELDEALGPFLWGLADALSWTEQKAREGHAEAVTHSRTLASIQQILQTLIERQKNED